MLGQKIKILRRYRDLTTRQLAEEVGVSHTAISRYENGEDIPSSSVLIRIIKALETSLDYLLSEEPEIKLEFRTKTESNERIQERIESNIKFQIERIINLRSLFPETRFQEFRFDTFKINKKDDIEDAAAELRVKLDLGEEPICNLVDVLEKKGFFIIFIDIDPEFDGITGIANNIPFIVVSKNIPFDRQRFTIAHELGHLILEIDSSLDKERTCDQFAGAFLISKQRMIQDLGIHRSNINLVEFLSLKPIYMVSLASIIIRAYVIGIIDKGEYHRLYKSLARLGWIKIEPSPLTPETTITFINNVIEAFSENYISVSKAASLLDMGVGTFMQKFINITEGRENEVCS